MKRHFESLALVVFILGLSACSGGGTTASGSSTTSSGASSGQPPVAATPPTPLQAARFLTHATLGPTDASVNAVTSSGYDAWIAAQMALPPTLLEPVAQNAENLLRGSSTGTYGTYMIIGAGTASDFMRFWMQSQVTAPDELRQRVALALSEHFVVSFNNSNTRWNGIAMAHYYDILNANAFGNFRDLMAKVTLNPEMAIWLSWIDNQNEIADANGNLTRHPDENYAREVMQLFTIGPVKLNPDGTPQLDAKGSPIATYTHDDIYGIARVLTGWNRDKTQMIMNYDLSYQGSTYAPLVPTSPKYHSVSAKTFLGTTIPATSPATAQSMTQELNTVLDTLFNHPNTAPFVCTRLIKSLVTSNPSPAYVQRVSTVFANDGTGVRGNLAAVVKAILLDSEALNDANLNNPNFGKVREPVLRFTNWWRAFGLQAAATKQINVTNLSDPDYGLNQSVMNPDTVFNFFSPSYVPPHSTTASAGLSSPEMQIVNEQTMVGYLNYIRNAISTDPAKGGAAYTTELTLAEDATIDSLLDRLNLLLMAGTMTPEVRSIIRTGTLSVAVPDPANTPKGALERRSRIQTAIFLTMAAPEYLVQK